mmetsp:Transcript_56673/g.133440  ORF Transcript_56673/g.133440 Transcript_56673/m.133440 type:complete len:601 (+) Transcript_56673:100-1902(+)
MRQGSACAVLALLLAVGIEHAWADGHFLYSTINWERASTENYDVTFTIRSSWTKSYSGWPANFNFSHPLLLRGYKTPTLTLIGDGPNATSTFLNLNVDAMREPGEPYGDWIEGETHYTHSFSGPGKYTAAFTGCCVAGSPGEVDFNLESAVELMDDEPAFSPRLLVLPKVHVAPGGSFTVPAVHPKGTLDAASYRWSIPRPVPGFSVAADDGIVIVAGNVQHGDYNLYLEVAVLDEEGLVTESVSSVHLQIVVLSPGSAPTLSAIGGEQFDATMDQIYSFRTGFPVHIMVNVQRTFEGSTLAMRHTSALPLPLTTSFDAVAGVLSLAWDKPCVGQAVEGVLCFAAMELPHALNVSSQMCLHIAIDEDEGPAFAAELEFLDSEPGSSLTWIMGRERAFAVNVEDAAVMDRVASLELSSNTSLPMGSMLEPAHLAGNTGRRVFRWMPLMTAGGGHYQLCFEAKDTPGVTYERCRLGQRSSMKCVTIAVTACKYAVRPQESMSDVAALFNTDWVQMWALNPMINSPDIEVGYQADLAAKGAVLNTGHHYTVGSGDYVAAVAYKFGTTVKFLINLNAQLAGMADNAPLVQGSTLCVIPNSCLRD